MLLAPLPTTRKTLDTREQNQMRQVRALRRSGVSIGELTARTEVDVEPAVEGPRRPVLVEAGVGGVGGVGGGRNRR